MGSPYLVRDSVAFRISATRRLQQTLPQVFSISFPCEYTPMAKIESDFKRFFLTVEALRPTPRRNRISPEQLDPYFAYLDAPHAEGYWRLTANWLKNGQVQKFLIQSLIRRDDKQGLLREQEDDTSPGSVVSYYRSSGFSSDEARSKRVSELTSRIQHF
jgi:hypothetical protein